MGNIRAILEIISWLFVKTLFLLKFLYAYFYEWPDSLTCLILDENHHHNNTNTNTTNNDDNCNNNE